MESEEYYLGRIAYEAYCQTTGWKSAVTGADLPQFNVTSQAIRDAWIAAAQGAAKPATAVRDREVDKLFQDLMVSDRDSRQDVKRKAVVEVPARLLKGLSDVRVHLAFNHDGKQEVVEDAVTVKLVGTSKRLERLTLHLDLELKGKG